MARAKSRERQHCATSSSPEPLWPVGPTRVCPGQLLLPLLPFLPVLQSPWPWQALHPPSMARSAGSQAGSSVGAGSVPPCQAPISPLLGHPPHTWAGFCSSGYHTFEAFFHYVCVLTSIHPTSTCIKMIYNGKQINIYVNWIALTTEQHIFFPLNCTSRPSFREALKHILSCKHTLSSSGESVHAWNYACA